MATAANAKTVTGFPLPQDQRTIGYPVAATAAYPFAVPPPLSPYSTFYEHPMLTTRFHPARSSFLCRLLSAASFGFAIVGFITLVLWLALKPRFLAFELDSATVASLNTTATELTATFDITLVFQNPNHKLTVSYINLDGRVSYGNDDRTLASTRLPPFSQGTQSETRVRAQFAVVNEFVDSGVAKGIAAERARGSVNFGVSLFAWIRFGSGILHSGVRPLRVECDPVIIAFPPNNNGTGTSVGPSNCCAV